VSAPVGKERIIGEAKARQWIDGGYAVEVTKNTGGNRTPSVRRIGDQPISAALQVKESPPIPFMMPPRYICGCGFVAKSSVGLKAHQRACKE